MKVKFLFFLMIFLTSAVISFSQAFTIPQEIKDEQTKKEFVYNGTKYAYKVVYPRFYDSTKKYPALIGLSGGLADGRVIDLCYGVYFRADNIQAKYITIMPFAKEEFTLKDFTEEDFKNLTELVKQKENVTENNWLAAGTSHGGNAAFNYARYFPELFEGIVVMPGMLTFDKYPEKWKEYTVVLAIGESENEDWKEHHKVAMTKLKGEVNNLIEIVMENQFHIAMPSYDISKLYEPFMKE